MTPSYRARAPKKDPEPEPLHEYSSLQVPVTGPAAQAIRKVQNSIPTADLAAEGLETEPHITCRWGLHFQTPSVKLRNALKAFGPIEVTLGKVSIFANDDADVLKVDVTSPDLHRLYALIGRMVPTHTTFPHYKPHSTIAYLKPGKGKKYAGDTTLVGQKLNYDSVVFSGKRGHREALPLGHRAPGPYRVR